MSHRKKLSYAQQFDSSLRYYENLVGLSRRHAGVQGLVREQGPIPMEGMKNRLWRLLQAPGTAKIFKDKQRVSDLWRVIIEQAFRAKNAGAMTQEDYDAIFNEATRLWPRDPNMQLEPDVEE